ncbi:MAG: MBOAT family protein [Clostridia bacterium]|nr:MBOAT family protein [Clostridia bacterium]
MTYTDSAFLFIFFPIALVLYNVLPKKCRGTILLLLSYIFFFIISRKLIIYIFITTFIIWLFSYIVKKLQKKRDADLEKCKKDEKKLIKEKCSKKQRIFLILSIVINLGLLVVLKYSGFIGSNINALFENFGAHGRINIFKFALPIGISFYTLQAISYVTDVHKGVVKPDTNIGRLALYLAFFPQIMEGPICRYSDTAESLWNGERTTYEGLTFGLQRIIFGLAKKLIIADRLNILVNEIFARYAGFDGGIVAAGMVLYTLQLYMDFSGVMDMAIGMGEVFNVKLPENFKQPFFSKSISDFWTRWHITLGAWLRDYIYYPVSMSKISKKTTSKLRKKIGNYYGPLITSTFALFLVWLINGFWHGSAWNFIFYGMYHFTLIMLGRLFDPLNKKLISKLHIDVKRAWYKSFQIFRTIILVFIGELFFRANGLKAGFEMFKIMILKFSFKNIYNGELLNLGIDIKDFAIVIIFTIIMFIISILKEKDFDIRAKIANRNIVLRWMIYLILIISVIIFGAYGVGYIPVDPMYANY